MATEAPTMYPVMRFRDAPRMIEFLKEAFGFEELAVHADEDGTIVHAELSFGPSILMVGSAREGADGTAAGQGWLYVAVEDPDVHLERARTSAPTARRRWLTGFECGTAGQAAALLTRAGGRGGAGGCRPRRD
jgi:uncharacterized glyoxalase superfamily protein PhnB